jgi:hypothetical protein
LFLRAPFIVGEFDFIFGLWLAGVLAGATKLPLSFPRGALISLGISFFIPAVLFVEAALFQSVPWILLGPGILHLDSKFLPLPSIHFPLSLIVAGVSVPPTIIMLLLISVNKLKSVFAFLILAVLGARTRPAIMPFECLGNFFLGPTIPASVVVRVRTTRTPLVFASFGLGHQIYIYIANLYLKQPRQKCTTSKKMLCSISYYGASSRNFAIQRN